MDRILYVKAMNDERLREYRQQAAIGRGTRRIFQIPSRRPTRALGTR
jgi:hypothetical protein